MKRPDYVKVLEKYATWLNTPDDERYPKTKVGFARLNNVSEQTLNNCDRKIEAESSRSEDNAWDSYMVNLTNIVLKPTASASHMQLFATIKGKLVEKREDTVKFEPNASDYIEIGRRVIEQIRQDYQQFGGSCPVCGECQPVRHEAHLDTEPDLQENREVATLVLSDRTV